MQTVVHESGHSLGMDHDFEDDDNFTPRYDSQGKPCKGQSYFMVSILMRKFTQVLNCKFFYVPLVTSFDTFLFKDYVFPPYSKYNRVPSSWSGCSRDDFKAAYQMTKTYNGKYCLK